MNFEDIQNKLKDLRDRIRAEGCITPDSEAELKEILSSTLISADTEIKAIQNRITAQIETRAGNDNKPNLSEEQMRRLSIIEKTGTGSYVVH